MHCQLTLCCGPRCNFRCNLIQLESVWRYFECVFLEVKAYSLKLVPVLANVYNRQNINVLCVKLIFFVLNGQLTEKSNPSVYTVQQASLMHNACNMQYSTLPVTCLHYECTCQVMIINNLISTLVQTVEIRSCSLGLPHKMPLEKK